MRKIILCSIAMLAFLLQTLPGISQKMTWSTKSKAAKELAMMGVQHMMNVELPQAYSEFSSALKLDPNFTTVLVLMANLNTGETRKAYAEKAMKSVGNKSEGEKLFAALSDSTSQQVFRDKWVKLHTMFPDDELVGFYYVQTRPAEERFAAAEEFAKKFPDNAAINNVFAYYYLQQKDNEMAKKYLDKYIALYPEGANPYDSMAEYYLLAGDKENSKKYYKMALEKYPFTSSSIEALDKMTAEEKPTDTK